MKKLFILVFMLIGSITVANALTFDFPKVNLIENNVDNIVEIDFEIKITIETKNGPCDLTIFGTLYLNMETKKGRFGQVFLTIHDGPCGSGTYWINGSFSVGDTGVFDTVITCPENPYVNEMVGSPEFINAFNHEIFPELP